MKRILVVVSCKCTVGVVLKETESFNLICINAFSFCYPDPAIPFEFPLTVFLVRILHVSFYMAKLAFLSRPISGFLSAHCICTLVQLNDLCKV